MILNLIPEKKTKSASEDGRTVDSKFIPESL